MSNWKIGSRIRFGFGLILVILLCLSGISYFKSTAIQTDANSVNLDSLPGMAQASRIQYLVGVRFGLLSQRIMSEDHNQLASIDARLNEFNRQLEEQFAQYERRRLAAEEKDGLAALKTVRDVFTESMARTLDLSRRAKNKEAIALYLQEVTPKYEKYQEAASHLVAVNRRLGEESSKRIVASSDSMVSAVVVGLMIALVLGVTVTVLISRSIVQPLEATLEFVQVVSRGDLTRRMDVDSKDELGQLQKAMGEMVSSLNSRAQTADAIARGDLRGEVELLSEADTLGRALREMLNNLRRTVLEVHAAADNVASGSHELSNSAQVLSEGASEQSSAAEESTASIEEMASSIQQNSDNAQQTDKIATKAAEDTRQSGEAVNRTMEAMKEISSKINIIEEIARKTDLLALNAAVEAARAGEHGKGFAVVASEVRKLAERSQLAAAEISTLTVEGVRLAEGAGAMLTRLVPDIRKTAELVRDIASSCNEQSVGAAQVNKAMQQLDQVIQQNASASEEIASTSEELSSQAANLQDIVGFFKLEAVDHSRRAKQKGGTRGGRSPKSLRHGTTQQLSRLRDAVKEEGLEIDLENARSAGDSHDREFEAY